MLSSSHTIRRLTESGVDAGIREPRINRGTRRESQERTTPAGACGLGGHGRDTAALAVYSELAGLPRNASGAWLNLRLETVEEDPRSIPKVFLIDACEVS